MNQPITLANSVPQPDERVRFYDARAGLYDFVVGSQLYHRWAWGMDPRQHGRFAARALDASGTAAVLDGGCGSLLFTATCYRQTGRPLTLLDASHGMLQRGRRRLQAGTPGSVLENVHFVQGDLERLPFEAASFGAVFHFGVLHCLERPEGVLRGFHRVLSPGGQLYLSSLVLGRARGDKLLARLARAGHVAEPRSRARVDELVQESGFQITGSRMLGSFYFVEATRA